METALLAECNVERSNFRARAADSNRLGLFGAQTRDPRFREDVSLDHARLQINIDPGSAKTGPQACELQLFRFRMV